MNHNQCARNAGRLLVIVLVMLMFTAIASAEWKEKVLYSFQGGSDGFQPAGGVVFDKSGNLYGATSWGGTICPSPGCGVVFEVSPPSTKGGAWTETAIYVFKGVQGGLGDGLTPVGGLIIDQQGSLYGTTSLGGNGPCILLGSPAGCGTVYKLSPPAKKGQEWTETILYNFQGGTDGYFPWGDLVSDTDGNLYGATQFGGGKGTTCNQFYGGKCGSVFKLSPPENKGGRWKEKILHRFAGGTDGANPNGGLVLDSKGAIYGTAVAGGYGKGICDPGGCGITFGLDPPAKSGGAWMKKVLYLFHGQDGASPAGLVFGKNGNLYGSATSGGNSGSGAVFVLAAPAGGGTPWKETVLYRFKDKGDGTNPKSTPVFDASGSLYGTALGGETHLGVVFRLRPPKHGGSWSLTTVYNFVGPPDGSEPEAELISDGLGKIYGMTQYGGTGTSCQGGCGTVFRANP